MWAQVCILKQEVLRECKKDHIAVWALNREHMCESITQTHYNSPSLNQNRTRLHIIPRHAANYLKSMILSGL